MFVQMIHEPQGEKWTYFATLQKNWMKNVEHAFGVL
jgi:hypothetical protein